MRRLLRILVLTMLLLMVAMVSALTAMRFAIHGREIKVPKLVGMTRAQAEATAQDAGLLFSVESSFYSSDVPEGRIVSQLPSPGATVRSGYRVRVALSLGPQRASVPNVLGQSGRAAEINVERRGLEVQTIAVAHLPGLPAGQVVAQSPAPEARTMSSPKVSLLITAPPESQTYVMPDFTGQKLADATKAVEAAGLRVSRVVTAAAQPAAGATIVRQSPGAGQKVTPETPVMFEVAQQP